MNNIFVQKSKLTVYFKCFHRDEKNIILIKIFIIFKYKKLIYHKREHQRNDAEMVKVVRELSHPTKYLHSGQCYIVMY